MCTGFSLVAVFHKSGGSPLYSFNREFKQIATPTSTTAVGDVVSWGQYFSKLAKFQARFLPTCFFYNYLFILFAHNNKIQKI